MKISEFLHLALPEEQWLPTISGVLRQFAEEECYVYERQPCWYLGKGCQARLHINADGTQATFIDDAGEQKWAVDSIAGCARRCGDPPWRVCQSDCLARHSPAIAD